MKDPNQIYDEQLKAITNIAHTDGYKEIKRFFQTELDAVKEQYPLIEEENLYRLQEKHKVISKFLTYLNNLESTQKIKTAVK
jgi:hypothetical protein